ncbi:hypothetical protein MLD38_029457 [Melastoma candidum]|uniref:Uncharacterized protein n=1 Tax=Melastoma candidum TaxID=119954 RepID=A0ACB9N3U4_9MYRT|nr:hypothetical protein MLD38_029457 [Melastoma candidum]
MIRSVETIDQHDVVPMAAKKVWNILRVLYFMLRKEISRRKLMSDLNLMMKRGKIAGKAFASLIPFHSSHHRDAGRSPADPSRGPRADAEYEFSCSNSPASGSYNCPPSYLNDRGFFSSLHIPGKRHGLFGCVHTPRTDDDEDVVVDMATIEAEAADQVSKLASPLLPGFGRTPRVRQLRITDSPYPLKDEGDGGKVDKAAEEFIQKFYMALQKQKSG